MELIEKVDMERLENVINCSNFPTKKPNDSSKWYKMVLSMFSYYKKHCNNEGQHITKYNRTGGYGRLVSSNSIQHMPKEIRSYLLNESLLDIDQEKSHFTIINWLFDQYNIEDEFIKEYLQDRDLCLRTHGFFDKQASCVMLNKENCSKQHSRTVHVFHKKIYGENGLIERMEKKFKKDGNKTIKNIKKMIIEKFNKSNKQPKNIRGKLFSRILQIYEDQVLQSMIEFIEDSGDYHIDVLMFDGLMIQKHPDIDENFLRRMEQHVLQNTTIPMKISFKSTKPDWVPIPKEDSSEDSDTESVVSVLADKNETFSKQIIYDLHQNCKELKETTQEYMDYMNNFFCHIDTPACFGYRPATGMKHRIIKQADIRHISLWNSDLWNFDPRLLSYSRVDALVDFSKNDIIRDTNPETGEYYNTKILNLYQRPSWKQDPNIEDNARPFFEFIYKIICDSDDTLNEFVLNWIAYLLQKGKVGIALILMGLKGVGKGTLKNALTIIIGDEYTIVDECGSRIGSRFNSHEQGKLLCVFEEVLNNNGERHSRHELMKNKITDTKTIYESKGIDAVDGTNITSYIYITNGVNPVKIEHQERRHVALDVSDSQLQNKNYFTGVLKNVQENVRGLRDYFQTRLVTSNDMTVVNTKANQKLLYINKTPTEEFIDDVLPLLFGGSTENSTDEIINWLKHEQKTHFNESSVTEISGKVLFMIFSSFCLEILDRVKIPLRKYFYADISKHPKYRQVVQSNNHKATTFTTRQK